MRTISLIDQPGYLVPGSVTLAILVWFLRGFCGIETGFFDSGMGSAIIALLLAYVLGHLVQLISAWTPGRRMERIGSAYSDGLMQEGSEKFTSEFRARLRASSQKVFGCEACGSRLYEFCYAYLVQNRAEKAVDRELFRAGMVRGLLIVAWAGEILSAFVFIKHLVVGILRASGIFLPVTSFLDYDESQLMLGILLVILFHGLGVIVNRLITRSVETVVESVYRNFGVLTHETPMDIQR